MAESKGKLKLPGEMGDVKAIFKSLVRNKNFMKLFWGQLVSSTGDWLATFALMSLVWALTKSSLAVGGMLILRIVPALFSGPIAAVISDRLDRRKILISCDIIRGAVVLVIPFIGQLWAIYTLVFLMEGISIIWLAARDASIPNLVSKDELTMANTLSLITSYAILPLSAGLFTVLVLPSRNAATGSFLYTYPTVFAFALDTVSFIISAAFFMSMYLESPKDHIDIEKSWKISESLTFAWKNPFARSLMTGAAVGCMGGGSLYAVGIGYVKQVLGVKSDVGFGILMALFGIGMIVGVVALQVLVKHEEKPYMLRLALLTMGSIMVGMALIEFAPLAYVLASLFGASFGILFLVAVTMVQENIEDKDRGKAFGAFHAISRIFLVLGGAISGILASVVDTRTIHVFGITKQVHGVSLALFISGILIALTSLVPLGQKKERYRDYFAREKGKATAEPSDSPEAPAP